MMDMQHIKDHEVVRRLMGEWKLVTAAAVLLLVVCVLMFRSCGDSDEVVVTSNTSMLDYDRDFNDLNDRHEAAAKKLGHAPFDTRQEAAEARRGVCKIETNRLYEVRRLTHSVPYVVPEVEEFLEDLGRLFKERLKKADYPPYKFQITSVTRTNEDVRKLRKSNVNASNNSVHKYGTTIDISWSKFTKVNSRSDRTISDLYLKRELGYALRDMREVGRCYVKHEKRQACFHITVRK